MSSELVFYLIQAAGSALAFFLAFNSFQRRSIQLGEEPTLPRYFAPRGFFQLGVITYSALIVLIFLLTISVWVPLRPLLGTLSEGGGPAHLLARLTGTAVLPVIAVLVFFVLLVWESRFNPLLIVRDAIYDIFALPRKAIEVYNVLRTSRLAGVSAEIRAQSTARLLVPSVAPGDFDKASDTVEYKWARNCVLFDKIQTYADRESYRRFFKEPALKWGQICILFNEMSEKVANWKENETHYTRTLELIGRLDHLTGLLARLLACLVVYGSSSDTEMWNTVVRLGGDTRTARLKHTWKYLLIYAGAIVFAVILGRETGVALYNTIFAPAEPLGHFRFDTFRWMLYSVTIYIVPIGLVFAGRVAAYRSAPIDASRYYGFYVFVMILGFLVSASVSALITGLAVAEEGEFEFLNSFVGSMSWGILPALMCGFVAYQMDSPAADDEPRSRMFALALLRMVGWGLTGMLIMLYATGNIEADGSGLRFTLVVTTAFVSAFLGAVTRFKTVQTSISDHVTSQPGPTQAQ